LLKRNRPDIPAGFLFLGGPLPVIINRAGFSGIAARGCEIPLPESSS
jgi:hypothetical protein